MGGFGRLLRFLLFLAFVGFLGLVGYALISDLPAPTREVVRPLSPQSP